jgi:hypothetical protein
MANINTTTALNINECARLIETVGTTTTVLVLGEMGIGKTAILKELTKRLPKYRPVYIDVPNTTRGDLFVQMPDRDTKAIEEYITSLIDFNDPRPVILMLDELLKALRMDKPLFTRLILERTLGSRKLPDGSVVFATSNQVTDGVSDTIEAHIANRLCIVTMKKATVSEWLGWAAENGISAVTRACVAMNPRIGASYTDGGNNELIFHPKTNPVTFASWRSIANADNVIRNRVVLGDNVVHAGVAGLCGEPFAQLMSAFIKLEKELISADSVLADPTGTALPEKPAALWMTMFNLCDAVKTQDDMTAACAYIARTQSRELESVFYTMVLNRTSTAVIAQRNDSIKKWMISNNNWKLMA